MWKVVDGQCDAAGLAAVKKEVEALGRQALVAVADKRLYAMKTAGR